MKSTRVLALIAVIALSSIGIGCKKKVAPAMPAAPISRESSPVPAAPPQVAAAPAHQAEPPAQAAPRYPDAATIQRIEELLARIQDAYFDYNQHLIRQDAQSTLLADSKALTDILKQYPEYKLTVEGHCDERGSSEFNMALGDARAKAAKEYLVSLGIPGDQLQTISLGKEKPVCTDQSEECWQKNRRAHIIAQNR